MYNGTTPENTCRQVLTRNVHPGVVKVERGRNGGGVLKNRKGGGQDPRSH
jgi:DNA-binding IscR family transcriptional regulator